MRVEEQRALPAACYLNRRTIAQDIPNEFIVGTQSQAPQSEMIAQIIIRVGRNADRLLPVFRKSDPFGERSVLFERRPRLAAHKLRGDRRKEQAPERCHERDIDCAHWSEPKVDERSVGRVGNA